MMLVLTLITRNSNSTDKPEVDSVLILLPPLHQTGAPFYGYLKLLSYTERKEVKTRMRDPGIKLRTSCPKAVHKPTVPSLLQGASYRDGHYSQTK